MNVHARFDLGGGNLKSSKINLRLFRLAPGPILSPTFINPPVISPTLNLVTNQPIEEVHDKFTIVTRNEENLAEVESILETPRHVARNPNIRNDIDCHEVKWMENNSLAKRD